MAQNSEVISVSELECPKRKLSYLIDLFLNPFFKEVHSYIKDSTDVLNKCQREICENKQIVTFVV